MRRGPASVVMKPFVTTPMRLWPSMTFGTVRIFFTLGRMKSEGNRDEEEFLVRRGFLNVGGDRDSRRKLHAGKVLRVAPVFHDVLGHVPLEAPDLDSQALFGDYPSRGPFPSRPLREFPRCFS